MIMRCVGVVIAALLCTACASAGGRDRADASTSENDSARSESDSSHSDDSSVISSGSDASDVDARDTDTDAAIIASCEPGNCAPRGRCVDSSGSARCECEAGFVADGLECVSAEVCATAACFFVDPAAAGPGDGSQGSPFPTLEGARDAIRAMRESIAAEGATVVLRGGEHRRASSFALGEQDSGRAGAPIIYRAYPGEVARITGGRTLSAGRPLTAGPVRDALPAAARASVRVIDLRADEGITDFGVLRQRGQQRDGIRGAEEGPSALELFAGDARMILARWPNAAEDGEPRWAFSAAGTSGQTLVMGESRARERGWTNRTANGNNIFVEGWLRYQYWDGHMRVTSIDAGRNRVTVEDAVCGNFEGVDERGELQPRRYFVYNVLEELDAPGEYWLDRSDGRLYFWPPSDAAITASVLEQPVITGDRVSHVRFEGIVIEHSRSHGAEFVDSPDVVFDRCVVRHTGESGVVFDRRSLARMGDEFINGEVYDVGESGVELHSGGFDSLTRSESRVHNSHIHHWARWVMSYRPAVFMGRTTQSAGSTVSHCLIEHGPHMAIYVNGPLHLVENNVIRNFGLHGSDLGAIYWYQQWYARGVIIRYNQIYDGYRRDYFYPRGFDTTGVSDGSIIGVYADGAANGPHVHGNLIRNVEQAFHSSGGRHFRIEHNVLVNTAFRIYEMYSPGGTWGSRGRDFQAEMVSRNYAEGLTEARASTWTQSDPWNPGETWGSQLAPYDTDAELGRLASGYRSQGDLVSNVFWRSPLASRYGFHFGSWGGSVEDCSRIAYGTRAGWIVCNNVNMALDARGQGAGAPARPVDPRFRDEAAGDFRVSDDSPIFDSRVMDPPMPREWNEWMGNAGLLR